MGQPERNTPPITTDQPLSFVEWNKQGRRVHKGQKAHSFANGEPLFVRGQTYDPAAQQRMSARLGVTGEWDDMPH